MRCLLLAWALACSACSTPTIHRGLPNTPPAHEHIRTVAFMAGCWRSEDDGVWNEETWTEPLGDSVFGVSRTVAKGVTVAFEFMSVRVVDNQLTLFASPGGKPATSFGLTGAAPQDVTFSNPAHDFPRRIRYWIDSKGALRARADDGMDGGRGIDLRWTRHHPR